MLKRRLSSLFGTPEGLVLLVASVIYTLLGLLDKYSPGIAPVTGFYGWLCLYMPIPLVIMYLKVGGLGMHFRTSGFGTFMMIATAAVPPLIMSKQMIFG